MLLTCGTLGLLLGSGCRTRSAILVWDYGAPAPAALWTPSCVNLKCEANLSRVFCDCSPLSVPTTLRWISVFWVFQIQKIGFKMSPATWGTHLYQSVEYRTYRWGRTSEIERQCFWSWKTVTHVTLVAFASWTCGPNYWLLRFWVPSLDTDHHYFHRPSPLHPNAGFQNLPPTPPAQLPLDPDPVRLGWAGLGQARLGLRAHVTPCRGLERVHMSVRSRCFFTIAMPLSMYL